MCVALFTMCLSRVSAKNFSLAYVLRLAVALGWESCAGISAPLDGQFFNYEAIIKEGTSQSNVWINLSQGQNRVVVCKRSRYICSLGYTAHLLNTLLGSQLYTQPGVLTGVHGCRRWGSRDLDVGTQLSDGGLHGGSQCGGMMQRTTTIKSMPMWHSHPAVKTRTNERSLARHL